MNPKSLFLLPLIFLGAAAAPSDCGRSATVLGSGLGSDATAPVGLADQPHATESTATEGYAAIHLPGTAFSCDTQLPTVGSPASLRNTDDDVMHGLPSSDVLAPINQQRQAPLFR